MNWIYPRSGQWQRDEISRSSVRTSSRHQLPATITLAACRCAGLAALTARHDDVGALSASVTDDTESGLRTDLTFGLGVIDDPPNRIRIIVLFGSG